MSVQQEKFKAIADRIRRYLGNDDLIKPNDFADKVDEAVNNQALIAYNSGKSDGIEQQQPIIDGYLADFAEIKAVVNDNGGEYIEDDTPTSDYAEKTRDRLDFEFSMGRTDGYFDGYNQGLSEGIEQGKQSAYDEFWDSYQSNGNRTDYARAFEGAFWNDDRFKPKYPLNNAQNCNYMFRYTNIKDLSSLNIVYCTGAYALCREAANLELMGNIYLAGNTSISQGFHSCSKLTKIGVLRVGAGTNLELAFYNCTALKEVTFTGTIGTSLGIGNSPLNRASIESIISCLSDTATGKTLTLKKTAVNTAFGIDVDDEATYPEGSEYYNLRHSKDNWTFSYV